MRTVTRRHSRYCARESRSTEGLCNCGHPRCLHELRSAYDHLIRPAGQCRAAKCGNGVECDYYYPDDESLAMEKRLFGPTPYYG